MGREVLRNYEPQGAQENIEQSRLHHRLSIGNQNSGRRAGQELANPAGLPDLQIEESARAESCAVRRDEDAAGIARAAKMLTAEAKLRWGADKVHLSGNDAMESMAVLVLGPDVCRFMGAKSSRALAREATVFGFGLANGISAEIQRRQAAELIQRGTGNAAMGIDVAAVGELYPPAGAGISAGMGISWLYGQLGPASAARNQSLARLWTQTWNQDDTGHLRDTSRQISQLAGKDLFESSFDFASGLAGFKGARPFTGHLAPVRLDSPAQVCKNGISSIGGWLSESMLIPTAVRTLSPIQR